MREYDFIIDFKQVNNEWVATRNGVKGYGKTKKEAERDLKITENNIENLQRRG